jgi:AraC family transcriptional regulator
LASRFRIESAPSFLTRTLNDNVLAVTKLKCDLENNGLTAPIPREDALLVTLQLKFCLAHDLWIHGKPVKTAPLPAGSVSIYDLRASPIINSIGPFHNLNFYFPRSALDAINDAEGLPRCRDLIPNPGEGFEAPIVQALGHSLMPAFERPEEADTRFVDHVTTATAAYVAQMLGSGEPLTPPVRPLHSRQLERLREIVRADLSGRTRIANFAAECGMTVRAFRTAFRKTTGVSPHEWLLECRVQLAMNLLRNNSATVEEVASASGFSSSAHLIRAFHAAIGTHPDEWRDSLR